MLKIATNSTFNLWNAWEPGIVDQKTLWFTKHIYVEPKTTIVAFTCVPCVRTILTCVCDIAMCVRDIIVHAFLEFNNRTLYSFENTGLSSHSSVHRHNHIVYCNQREKTNGFSYLFHALWPNHRFILLVVIDGHLAWSYGRFSHTVSKISCWAPICMPYCMPGCFLLATMHNCWYIIVMALFCLRCWSLAIWAAIRQ